ncbi:ATP dependent DNA ligase region [Oesophagostomum dentatum]|uniref:ATP dependent DNA ligase region n=1 Tax=Oesophagostomum dentatum TaxID=61180 RepID=A0A0B1SC28_OESDE|nr:ATP dependent DNA ligase region [Oesophagostomum dentatum]
MMSVFLMGVYDKDTKTYRTVTKCGNGHTDDVLDAINKKMKDKVIRIDGDFDRLPKWLNCSRSLVPDFVVKDPKDAPVWEITGAEFSKSDKHTAGGISIRFPRVTRIRDDKNWESATSLEELKRLYECSKVKSDLTNVKVDDETPLYVKEGMDHGNIEKLAEEEAAANAVPESSNKKERKRSAEDDIEEKEVKKAKKEKVEDKDEEEAKCPPGKRACKYGADCYRKNKEHKEEFWHPPKK